MSEFESKEIERLKSSLCRLIVPFYVTSSLRILSMATIFQNIFEIMVQPEGLDAFFQPPNGRINPVKGIW